MYLFFDTETTGTPANYKAPMTDVNNWPRIIQLAFIVFDEKRSIISEYCQLIKPDNWVVPVEKFWIDNGYSTEKNAEKGVPIAGVLSDFVAAVNASKYMIAHNINFDYNIVGAEMIRAEAKAKVKLIRLCTMAAGTDVCRLPGPYGFKWPKLTELHEELFKTQFVGAHDALNDVRATAKCFFELVDRNVIKL